MSSTSPADQIFLTRDQSRTVDQIAIDDYAIPGIVLMENAARNAAEVMLRRILRATDVAANVLILCGGGNNGGDGYAIARHLHNAGVDVCLIAAVPVAKLDGDAKINCEIVRRMALPIAAWPSDEADEWLSTPADAVVDALLGTGFSGSVRSPMDQLIERVNAMATQRVAIDVPSGLDCDTGAPSNATMRAALTITFVARKTGFKQSAARPYIGEVEVVDIGAPPEIIDRCR